MVATFQAYGMTLDHLPPPSPAPLSPAPLGASPTGPLLMPPINHLDMNSIAEIQDKREQEVLGKYQPTTQPRDGRQLHNQESAAARVLRTYTFEMVFPVRYWN